MLPARPLITATSFAEACDASAASTPTIAGSIPLSDRLAARGKDTPQFASRRVTPIELLSSADGSTPRSDVFKIDGYEQDEASGGSVQDITLDKSTMDAIDAFCN